MYETLFCGSESDVFAQTGRALWHGDGRNRYFDKSVQFVVFANGKAGMIGEVRIGNRLYGATNLARRSTLSWTARRPLASATLSWTRTLLVAARNVLTRLPA